MTNRHNPHLADAALAGASQSPDASLAADDGLVATSAAGLTYPWGDESPAPGTLIDIAPGVRWARIPMPGSLDHINSWILGEDSALTIVDCGLMLEPCSAAWKALFAGPLEAARVERILCTHMHPDHIGLAGWLARRFDVPLAMTRGEWLQARLMLTDMRDAPPDEVSAMQKAAGWDADAIDHARAQGWSRLGQVIFRLPYGYQRLVDGQLLHISGQHWRVVVGSGHSPEHACLWNEAAGILISGDQILPRISSNVSLNAGEPEGNPLGEWLASIDKLLSLPDDLLVCPAHGEPFYGFHARLQALKAEHLERLDVLADALGEAQRAVDIFPLLFRRPIGDKQRGLATGEALAHLRWLEVAGRIRRETRDDVWWWRRV